MRQRKENGLQFYFLGPIGFGISTTYFILDVATGGFGVDAIRKGGNYVP
ncbi:MAG: hypothetical protein QM751_10620 [Paludibacteraceae bacterium]